MSRTVENIEISKNEMQAWQYRCKGLTLKQIAKKMKKGTTTISRWIKQYEQKADIPEAVDFNEEKMLQALEDQAFEGLKKSLKSKNDAVRLKAQMFILNGRGKLIEKKINDVNINYGDLSPDELINLVVTTIQSY